MSNLGEPPSTTSDKSPLLLFLILFLILVILSGGLTFHYQITINEPQDGEVKGGPEIYEIYFRNDHKWHRIATDTLNRNFGEIDKFIIMKDLPPHHAIVKFKDGTWTVWTQEFLGQKLVEQFNEDKKNIK